MINVDVTTIRQYLASTAASPGGVGRAVFLARKEGSGRKRADHSCIIGEYSGSVFCLISVNQFECTTEEKQAFK